MEPAIVNLWNVGGPGCTFDCCRILAIVRSHLAAHRPYDDCNAIIDQCLMVFGFDNVRESLSFFEMRERQKLQTEFRLVRPPIVKFFEPFRLLQQGRCIATRRGLRTGNLRVINGIRKRQQQNVFYNQNRERRELDRLQHKAWQELASFIRECIRAGRILTYYKPQ